MSSRRVESFVVRIVVHEEGAEPMNEWSGRIQHIATGDEYHFKRVQDLLSFISVYLGETASLSTAAQLDTQLPCKRV